jgi:hypothetical protein
MPLEAYHKNPPRSNNLLEKSLKDRLNWWTIRQFFYFPLNDLHPLKNLIIKDFLEFLGLVGYYSVGNSSLLFLTMKKS